MLQARSLAVGRTWALKASPSPPASVSFGAMALCACHEPEEAAEHLIVPRWVLKWHRSAEDVETQQVLEEEHFKVQEAETEAKEGVSTEIA